MSQTLSDNRESHLYFVRFCYKLCLMKYFFYFPGAARFQRGRFLCVERGRGRQGLNTFILHHMIVVFISPAELFTVDLVLHLHKNIHWPKLLKTISSELTDRKYNTCFI
jgi:hypothetical protein